VLGAIRDPDNVPSNRERMLAQLIDFADRITEPAKGEVFATALAAVETSGVGTPPAQGVQAAMGGDPDDARMTALVCAAAYAVGEPERVSQLGELIEDMAVHLNPKLRRGAFAAARRLPDLSADALPPLLMGLRDPDPGTAIAAFAAFTERVEWQLTRPQWKLFLLAVRTTADLPHANLRRHAAAAVSRRRGAVPSGLRRQASDLIDRFRSDPSAAVRFEVQEAESSSEATGTSNGG
jgi:HEAT repeat protein